MGGVLQNVTRILARYADKKIAVGVSGGRDSMCLLHAVLSCGIIDKHNITVIHVNHCLRDEADSDELFVKEYCKTAGVECKAFRVDVTRESKSKSHTIEQAARDLRYSAFRDVIERGDAEIVLTAHHALDNAETVLMHIFRGSGQDGLCGMREQSGYVVRPLLGVYPDELDRYAADNNIDYVVDRTNLEDDADRNYIRLNILPAVEKRYAGAVRAINALAADTCGVCAELDGLIDGKYISYESGCVRISDAALCGTLATHYVKRALMYFSTVDVTRDMLVRAAELVHMRTGAIVQMNNGVVAAREYGCVALYVPRRVSGVEYPIRRGANYIDGLAVDISATETPMFGVRGGTVDLDKLDGAVLRFKRDGDYFTPFGGGRKKLKQYFIDNKICRRVRERIPLICRGSEVLVIVGMQISELVKITESTTDIGVVRSRICD